MLFILFIMAALYPGWEAMDTWFGQAGFQVRHEWGREGARRAASRGDVLAIVDVLRFTTTVAAAVANGYPIRPCRDEPDAEQAVFATGCIRGGKGTRFTLSPLDYPPPQSAAEACPAIALPSPNGATCSRVEGAPLILAGALVNASTAGQTLESCIRAGRFVTVVSCGERCEEPGEDGPLRFAVEDYIGAGAIITAIESSRKSPEALACQGAFLAVKDRLAETLESCGSGIELAAKGRIEDVRFAAQLDCFPIVPALVAGMYYPWASV
jgi:2-phosphosulfolactate phosphatase